MNVETDHNTLNTSRRWWPLLILATFLLIAAFFFSSGPEAKRMAPDSSPRITVETQQLQLSDFAIEVESYGTVQPRTQSLLVAQVSGQITEITQKFRDGSFFQRGDLLLQIDPRDARANVKIAEATLMDARQALQEENARAAQAAADWERLARDEPANDLVLRKPQLLAAQARLVSAEANLDKARLALERTRITAPFDGRVLRQMVDLGQVVNVNSQLGEVYATDAVEIRLPIRNRDLAYIELPERYTNAEADVLPDAKLHSSLIKDQTWYGKIVRTESAIDQNARQLHVVAQIDKPFAKDDATSRNAADDGNQNEAGTAIKIGQYVTATIEGKTLNDVISVPESAIYQNSFVYIVRDGMLHRREIDIAWQNGELAIIDRGLNAGDQLVLTPLGQVTSGTRVNTAETPAAATAEQSTETKTSNASGTMEQSG